jgi:hypothetical protein
MRSSTVGTVFILKPNYSCIFREVPSSSASVSVESASSGCTYHSVFKIPRDSKSKNQDDIDGIQTEAASLASVNERLQGVDYIFLDEISMVSCNDLQQLATQAAKARNIHDSTFGGLSVITAGDFTQLPPTTGPSLYSNLVNTTMHSATTVKSQKCGSWKNIVASVQHCCHIASKYEAETTKC